MLAKNRDILMKNRRMAAILLTVMLVISCGACTKNHDSPKKNVTVEVDEYTVSRQLDFEDTISVIDVQNNILYGYYANDIYELEGSAAYGLVWYDLDTEEQKKVALAENEKILHMYVDGDNFAVEIQKNDTDDQMIRCLYDRNLELVSGETQENEETLRNIQEEDAETTIYRQGGKRILFINREEIQVQELSGKLIQSVDVSGMDMKKIVERGENQFLLLGSKEKENGCSLYTLDLEADEPLNRLEQFSGFNVAIFKGENDDSLLLSEDGYLYQYDIQTQRREGVLRYIDNGLDGSRLSYTCRIDEDNYALLFFKRETFQSELVLLRKNGTGEKKKEIHFATMGVSQQMEQKILEFNLSNDQYRIVIDDYGRAMEYPTADEWKKGLEQFNLDILYGKGADLIDLESYADLNQYTNKGIIEDLMPYIQKDEELSEEDFLPNILNAFKREGKLYYLPTSFSVSCIMTTEEMLKEDLTRDVSWTMEEFMESTQNIPDNMEIFDAIGSTSEWTLKELVANNMENLIDWKNLTCNFNSEEFISLLEYCKEYFMTDSELIEKMNRQEYLESDSTKIKNHKVAFVKETVSPGALAMEEQLFDEDIVVKGYPSSHGIGLIINDESGLMIGINSKSKYKDVAWDFMRQWYLYEQQSEVKYGYPIRKDCFEEYMENIKTEELKYEHDGKKYYSTLDVGDMLICVDRPTDEMIERAKQLIEMADTVSENYFIAVFDIIEEETESYFVGQKTAEEVADIIQSRVSIYVSERG